LPLAQSADFEAQADSVSRSRLFPILRRRRSGSKGVRQQRSQRDLADADPALPKEVPARDIQFMFVSWIHLELLQFIRYQEGTLSSKGVG